MKRRLVYGLLIAVAAFCLTGCSKSTKGLTVETLSFEADTDIEEETFEELETESEEEEIIVETEAVTEAATEAAVVETEFNHTPTETVENASIEEMEATMFAIDDVNIRSNYGTGSETLSSFYKGDEIQVTGKVNDENGEFTGWYQVSWDGNSCYVWGEYLSESKDGEKSASADAVVAEAGIAVNVFSSGGDFITVYSKADGTWEDNSGMSYVFKNDIIMADDGKLYRYYYSPNASSQVDITGNKRVLTDANNYSFWVFEQSDGSWVNIDNIAFTDNNDGTMSADGVSYTSMDFPSDGVFRAETAPAADAEEETEAAAE